MKINFTSKCRSSLVHFIFFIEAFLLRTNSVSHHNCATQKIKGNLKEQRNKEDEHITKDFSSWKQPPKCFQSHQDSACHRAA